jgi:hypothetical protein
MATDDPHDLERVDQEIRINELKERAKELTEGEMVSFEADDAPPGIVEQFWQRVVQYEEAPWTSQFEKLTEQGVEFPPPEELDDRALHDKLWEIINALARRNVFLSHTDHLSDRELYEHLVTETLHEATKDVPYDPHAFMDYDMLGGCSDEDIRLLVTYYADDEERRWYAEDWFDGDMPERRKPPYDRDRHLPQPPNESDFDEPAGARDH